MNLAARLRAELAAIPPRQNCQNCQNPTETAAREGFGNIGNSGAAENSENKDRAAWEERAAIRQYDGAMSRADAEAGASADLRGKQREEPSPPACQPRDHRPPPPDLVERLAQALATPRPWQHSIGPEAADYWRSRALAMLDRLDPLARGLLVQAEEAAARQ